MKGLTKTIVALALVITVLATMGMSALAATGTYSTKTIYQADNKISVVANASNLAQGDIVTYVATTDANDVNENTIVYLNQTVADASGAAQFTYTTDVTDINASMFFGGSKEPTRVFANRVDELEIAVTLNNETIGTVHAAKQETNDLVVIRKFDLSSIANFSATEITAVSFDGTPIENFYVDATTLIVSTNVINKNGTLAITSTDAASFADPTISRTTKVEGGKLIAVAKAPVGEKFGIVLYTGAAPTITTHAVAEESSYVVLPALGKNVDGIYAVEVEAYAESIGAKVNVAAYAFDGNTCVLSDAVTVGE